MPDCILGNPMGVGDHNNLYITITLTFDYKTANLSSRTPDSDIKFISVASSEGGETSIHVWDATL